MGFIARSYDTAASFTDAQALEALERVVPADAIRAATAANSSRVHQGASGGS